MKKILSVLLFAILFVSILSGCKQEENTASLIAKNLDNNLNNLSVAVNKLDSVDNKYLYNPDIYSSLSNTTDTQNKKFVALAFNEVETAQIANESVKQALIDKITDRLLSQGSNTNDCYTCKKYCDDNGNCYYTDCNGNNYCCDNSGNCYDCTTIPSSCSYIGQRNISCNDNFNLLTAEQISTRSTENTNSSEIVDDNTILNDVETPNEIIDENPDTTINTPSPRVKMYYFTQDSFSPIKLKYNPRYISQYNETAINDQIESYLYKVQKLYAMSEDSIEANTILHSCKDNIIDAIKEIRDLNACIINGKCEPSIQELQALNNYIADIKTTTRRLKDCHGELNTEINKISEASSSSMINSVDVMNSNYMRLLNHIDTRVTYHKSAIATLEQVKYLLDNAVNGNNISEEELEEIIESFTIEENVDINNSTDNNSDMDNTTNDNDVNDGTMNDEIFVDENTNVNNDEIIDNNVEENIVDNETDNETNNDSTDVFVEKNLEEDTYDSEIENQIDETDENLNTEINDDSIVENEEENTTTNSIIDSYSSTNSWSNIDTYKNQTNSEEIIEENITEDNVAEDTIIENNDNVDNNVIDNNVKENVSIDYKNDNNTNTGDNNYEDIDSSFTIDDNIVDNSNLNNNDAIINTPATGTTNNGVYQNSVITQNNLNNSNGYGGYYYTADGEIKNNGMNNNNEIGNNGNTIENNLNRNDNVNTYGYNTLLDMINQGTVNNGINTL